MRPPSPSPEHSSWWTIFSHGPSTEAGFHRTDCLSQFILNRPMPANIRSMCTWLKFHLQTFSRLNKIKNILTDPAAARDGTQIYKNHVDHISALNVYLLKKKTDHKLLYFPFNSALCSNACSVFALSLYCTRITLPD